MRAFATLALAAAAATAVIAGAASGAGAGILSSDTALTVTFWENGSRTADRNVWTLRCNPARGTISRPANACRRFAAGGWRLVAPVPDSAVCTEIYGGPQVARVVGFIEGRRVWARFTRQNGCQIDRWSRLSPWLLPPGGVK
jgi:subtilisin inhibitor-like